MFSQSRSFPLLAAPLLLAGCASLPLEGKRADQAAIYTLYHHAAEAGYNFDGESRITSLRIPGKSTPASEALMQELAGSFRFQYRGAVDMTQGRIELIPTVRFTRPQAEAWVRFPLQLQLDTLTLYVDGSVADLMFPSLKHKLVKFQLPQDKLKDVPVAAVLAEVPEIVQRVYAAVERQAYTFQPLTAADRQRGAQYRIRLTLDPVADRVLTRQMVTELVASIKRHSDSPDVQAFADGLAGMAASEPLRLQSESQTELLVSRQGKLLAMEEQRSVAVGGADGMKLGLLTRLDVSNSGKPVFTLQPTAANVVDYKNVELPAWMKPAVTDAAAEPAEEADKEADAAAQAAPAAPVKPATKATPAPKAKPKKRQLAKAA
ncbi:hypothetical protein ACFPAG_18050 [Vogesella sp. GCM10023246]|uniref:Lipoprotein n=1 Tax=Vogesella oryzagri TaxID=3160864 RepID=A0ABV1M8H0_9NEIS